MNFGRNVGSWVAITAVAALGTFAAATTQGCTITTDSNPDFDSGFDFDSKAPATDAGTDTATPDTGPDPAAVCAACADNACGTTDTACTNDTGCSAIRTCASQAGASLLTCINAQPGASRKVYYDLAKCETTAVCTSCASSCASIVGTVCVDAGTSACDQCAFTVCNAEQTACAAGTDCAAYITCIEAAQDAAAIAKCDTDHPTGKDANAKLSDCSKNFCTADCAAP